MPRRKASLGKVRFSTCYPDEFQRWLYYELANVKQWNQDKFDLGTGLNAWTFETKKAVIPIERSYKISWDGRFVTVESQLSAIHLRAGLVINMGQGRIELEGQS